MFNIFFSENYAVYEILWKSKVEPDGPQMTVQCGACALHDRHTLRICNTYCLSTVSGYANAYQPYVYTYVACVVKDISPIRLQKT